MLPQTRLPCLLPPGAPGPKEFPAVLPCESLSTRGRNQLPSGQPLPPQSTEHLPPWSTEHLVSAVGGLGEGGGSTLTLEPVTRMLTVAAPLCTCCSFSCTPFPALATSNGTLPLTVPQHKQRALTPAVSL